MYEDEVFPLIKNRGPWRQAKKDERKKTPFAPPPTPLPDTGVHKRQGLRTGPAAP